MTTTLTPDAVFNPGQAGPLYEQNFGKQDRGPGFFDGLSDNQLSAIISTPINLVLCGLWTWGALTCLAMPGVGWAFLAGMFGFFAVMNAIGFFAGVFAFVAG